MPVEIGLWRVDGDGPAKLTSSGVPLESRLEGFIERDPTILGTPLLLIGRQVPTGYGTFIDLLAVDADGALHVLELKRNRTPREVVAQVLDYASWVKTLTHQQVLDLFATHNPAMAFEQAWTDRFGGNPPRSSMASTGSP
jgi:RecB family endonuclease NucS